VFGGCDPSTYPAWTLETLLDLIKRNVGSHFQLCQVTPLRRKDPTFGVRCLTCRDGAIYPPGPGKSLRMFEEEHIRSIAHQSNVMALPGQLGYAPLL